MSETVNGNSSVRKGKLLKLCRIDIVDNLWKRKTINFHKVYNFHIDNLFQIIWGKKYTMTNSSFLGKVHFRMQVNESGFAIHPSPAKHLMRPSLAFFEYFYGFENYG